MGRYALISNGNVVAVTEWDGVTVVQSWVTNGYQAIAVPTIYPVEESSPPWTWDGFVFHPPEGWDLEGYKQLVHDELIAEEREILYTPRVASRSAGIAAATTLGELITARQLPPDTDTYDARIEALKARVVALEGA